MITGFRCGLCRFFLDPLGKSQQHHHGWNELGYQEAAGKLLDGKSHVLGMAENGITVVKNNLLSAAGKAAVDKAISGLKSGALGVAP